MRKSSWKYQLVRDLFRVTDYVSNGSFATLKENVKYKETVDYAILIRLADYSNNFDESKYVYVDRHAYDFLRKSSLKGGEIIMSNVGSIGKVFICPKLNKPMTLGPNSILIDTPNNNFYYYYFLSPAFMKNLEGIKTQATLSKFNKTQFKTLSIPVPPLPEQQQIVDYLDGAFAKIDQLKANAEKQLEDAQSLFSAALEEAMSPKEGWEEKTLGEICSKIGSGATPKGGKKVYIEKGVSLVRSMNVRHGFFDYTELAHINDEAASKLNGVTLNKDDILFNITGASIARCCVLPEDVLPARVNQHVCILRIKEGAIPQFLCYCLISKKHQKELLAIGEAASTRQALTKNDMEKHIISFPNKQAQQSIVSHLDALSAKVNQLKENYKTIVSECDALKQALLREIFE